MTEEDQKLTHPQKVELVRELPQETKDEKDTKIDQALALQEETYLSYANIMLQANRIMINHPDTNFQNFMTAFKANFDSFSNPEDAYLFLSACNNENIRTKSALSKISKDCGLEAETAGLEPSEWDAEVQVKMGSYIYTRMTGHEPKGTVSLTDNVFGINLDVANTDDIKEMQISGRGELEEKLSKDKHWGGFYNYSTEIESGGEKINFPLIVAEDNVEKTPGFKKHEIAHAVNRAVIRTVNAICQAEVKGREDVAIKSEMNDTSANVTTIEAGSKFKVIDTYPNSPWVFYMQFKRSESGVTTTHGWIRRDTLNITNSDLENRWGKGARALNTEDVVIDSEEKLQEFLQVEVRKKLFSRAKDELIADYRKKENFTYVANVTRQGGSYDLSKQYLAEINEKGNLRLPEGVVKKITDEFWEEYKKDITAFARSAKSLSDIYTRMKLSSRKEMLPFILDMVPIPNWQDQPGRKFLQSFRREAELYTHAQALINVKQFRYANDPDYRKGVSEFMDIVDFSAKNPTRSMIPKLAVCVKTLEAVKTDEPVKEAAATKVKAAEAI